MTKPNTPDARLHAREAAAELASKPDSNGVSYYARLAVAPMPPRVDHAGHEARQQHEALGGRDEAEGDKSAEVADDDPELGEPSAQFEDPKVQTVYRLLCSGRQPANREEHWEGWIARHIVDALSGAGAQPIAEPVTPDVAEPA